MIAHSSPSTSIAGSRRCARGITLVETCIVMAIIGITASMAIPMVSGAVQRRQFEGVAAELATDLRYARSEAVARHRAVAVSFESDGKRSCYSVHTGAATACHCLDGTATQPSSCDGSAIDIKTVRLQEGGSIKVLANNPAITFSATSGAAAPGTTITIAGPRDTQVRHIVSVAGRVRSCVAIGTTSLGYGVC